MKSAKLFSFLISILFILNLNAQDYERLVKENNTWVLYYAPDDFDFINYSAYKIEGDTIIDAIHFKKIYAYDLAPNQQNPYIIETKYFAGILREDTLEKKVYGELFNPVFNNAINNSEELCPLAYDFIKPQERLIIDFGKTVGDTLKDCYLDNEEYNTVIIADSVDFRFDKNRRVLKSIRGLELIEGVGYQEGLFMQAHTWVHAGYGFGLAEFCEESEIMNCHLITSNYEINNTVDIEIFPNPANSYFNIRSNRKVEKIRLFSLTGKTVLQTNSSLIAINNELLPGLYILEIVFKSNFVSYKKLQIIR